MIMAKKLLIDGYEFSSRNLTAQMEIFEIHVSMQWNKFLILAYQYGCPDRRCFK